MNVIDTVKQQFLSLPPYAPATDHYNPAKWQPHAAFVPTVSPTVNALVATGIKVDYTPVPNPRYDGETDSIHMLPPEAFESAEHYAFALAHELVHWTGKHARTGRMAPEGMYGWQEGVEEMTAQLGAALLMDRDALFSDALQEYTATYVASWSREGYTERPKDADSLQALLFGLPSIPKEDRVKAFDKAAADAQEAVAFLLSAL